MWIQQIEEKLTNIYGASGAKQVTMNIIPSCIADFKKMLDDAGVGATVEEEYKTEDGKATVLFSGIKRAGGHYLTGLSVNGEKIALSEVRDEKSGFPANVKSDSDDSGIAEVRLP